MYTRLRFAPRSFLPLLVLLLVVPMGGILHAQPSGDYEQRLARVEQALALHQGASAINTGDNAWVLVSSALVLMMTAPGLILFYGGLVRTKNVLSTMMHSLILMGIVSVLWAAVGYSMAFSEGSAIVGNPLTYFMLRGVGAEPNPDYAGTIPQETFMLFQMMFAIITPALISGAMAERVKFKGYVFFIILWTLAVYFPLCHMMWGKGGLFNWALGGQIPVLDFAGGTVVHISSGCSALVCAILLGRRAGYPRESMLPHNVVYSLIGAGLLWVGWFGFNAGSSLSAGSLAASAFAATHFSAAAGALSWALMECWSKGKPSVLGAASGMVAGLATITPAAGFVSVGSALLIGLAGGTICYFAVSKLKARFGYDDSLDVFGVHGIGSTVGMLMLGMLACGSVNPALLNTFQVHGATVPLTGGWNQLLNQAIGVAFTAGYASVGTLILFTLVNKTLGMRVDEDEEYSGLDITQHGESAYNTE